MDRLTKQTLQELCTMLRLHVEATHERLTKLEHVMALSSNTPTPTCRAVRKPLEQADEKNVRILVAAIEATRRTIRS